jgi:hypothetical protein
MALSTVCLYQLQPLDGTNAVVQPKGQDCWAEGTVCYIITQGHPEVTPPHLRWKDPFLESLGRPMHL